MQVEVDQSGKIGQTNVDTVLAFSNGQSYSILIPRRVKQACLHELRRRRISASDIYLRLFAVGLFYLLRGHIHRVGLVIIDQEYPGQEQMIKQRLYNLFRRNGQPLDNSRVTFGHIGKGSQAHHLSLAVYRGVCEADSVLTVEEVLSEF